jgi:hypothetical protein
MKSEIIKYKLSKITLNNKRWLKDLQTLSVREEIRTNSNKITNTLNVVNTVKSFEEYLQRKNEHKK